MKLSIIIPVYNVEKYLSRCLDSVLNQGLQCSDYEVIVINDGSTDNSLEIALSYAENHDNITVIDSENAGVSKARNCGIDCAKGKYIYFLDSDDYLIPNSLQILVDTCEKNSLDILAFISRAFPSVSPSDTPILEHTNFDFQFSDNLLSPIVTGENYIASINYRGEIWAYILHRDFLQKSGIRFVEGRFLEDLIFSLELILSSKRMAHLTLDAHRYRLSSGSIMGSKNPSHSLKIIRDMQFVAMWFSSTIQKLEEEHANPNCIVRLKDRRQSIVCFSMVRMLKSTITFDEVKQRMDQLTQANAYPLNSFIGKDYNGVKYQILTELFKTKRRFYLLFRPANVILRFKDKLFNSAKVSTT